MSESVVHPLCKLESMLGSILIGRRCIIQERCHIGARPAEVETARAGDVALGDYVTVEAAAIIEAGPTEVGEDTVIGIGARVGSGAKIGKVGPPLTK
jgi:dynactin-6